MHSVMREVRRERLVELLREATASPLTVVQAPYGYGKTVAVRQFAEQSSLRVVWLQAGVSEVDLPRPDLLANPRENTLVVFDDFHEASDLASAEFRRMMSQVPLHVRLLVITRRDLRLPVARWRAQGLVADIGLDDLRFRPVEAIAAFDDGELDEGEIAAIRRITERSEGWVAGIHVLAPTLGAEIDPAAGSALLDAVLADHPVDLQEFVLTTSVLFTFTADLCRVVTGRGDSGELIDRARAANLLLLPVDDRAVWFRYQRLFAELLRARLAERRPDEVRALHRRAAAWLLERHEPDAVGHLVAAGDGDDALIGLVSEVEFLSRGGRSRGVDWSRVFPAKWVEQSPLRMIYVASVLIHTGWSEQAAVWLDAAERADSTDPAVRALLGATRAVWHAIDGDGDEALLVGREALALMDDPAGSVSGRRLVGMLAMLLLVRDRADEAAALCDLLDQPQSPDMIRALLVPALRAGVAERRGELRVAERLARAALHTVATLELPFHASISEARIALARVLRERGEFDEAESQALAAAEAIETQGWGAVAEYCRVELAKVRVARAGPRAGLTMVEQMRAGSVPAFVEEVVDALEARLRMASGDLERVVEILDGLPPTPQVAVMRARVALVRHDPDAAERYLGDLVGGDVRTVLLRSLISARIAAARGDDVARDEHLLAAAKVGAREGFCAAFLELAIELMTELRALAEERGQLRPLLVRLDHYVAAMVAGMPHEQSLSQRELGVLRYLPTRLTNREIAAELDITTNTLKTHLRSLYRKLNVSSRDEAVRQGRASGLLRR